MRNILIMMMLAFPLAAQAVLLKGKALKHQKFRAELTLDKGSPVKGTVRFGLGKKAVFRAYDGTEVDIRVRPICATGADGVVDTCWPNLQVEMDDLSSRTGVLKILLKK